MIEANGMNGQLELHDDFVRIRRKGVMGFLTQGLKGDKDIALSSITSVQFKKAGLMVNGYIQFAFMGGQEAQAGIFQAGGDENTVMFTRGQGDAFDTIRDEIDRRRFQKPVVAAGAKPNTSVADELLKLAGLKEKGLLSEEEFDAEKAKLLAR